MLFYFLDFFFSLDFSLLFLARFLAASFLRSEDHFSFLRSVFFFGTGLSSCTLPRGFFCPGVSLPVERSASLMFNGFWQPRPFIRCWKFVFAWPFGRSFVP